MSPVKVMGCESLEQAACRTTFNYLIKFPSHTRLEAATKALQIVEDQLGRDCALYKTVKILQTVYMVHRQIPQKPGDVQD